MSDWLLIALLFGSLFALMWAAQAWFPDDRDGDDQW